MTAPSLQQTSSPEQADQQASESIEELKAFRGSDLHDLCEATEATIMGTYGFSIGLNRYCPPERDLLERYFKGVLLVPERHLFVARSEGTIAGSIQLVSHSRYNETSSFAASVDNHFVAPWARGHGLARALLEAAELKAKAAGYLIIKLSVRATRTAAIQLYERSGYHQWGFLPKYELMGEEMVAGHFFYKDL